MRTLRVLIPLFLALAVAASAQDALTNDAVVKMVKSGLGEGLVVTMIQSRPGKYSLTPDDLVKLKEAGVSEKILTAMVTRNAGGGSPAGSAPANTASGTGDLDIPAAIEIGVYYKKGGAWAEMLPEVVNWKTGGVLKHIATVGVVKGDVNGHIDSPHSRNSLKSPVEVLVYAPEGMAITEYQLIHLHENNDSREFRTVTGGVMHESGGATRDVVAFEGKKIASRTYKVILPSLGAGEFGFLPPEAVSLSKGASIGKMYTFRILE
jgi:hypothetical protein